MPTDSPATKEDWRVRLSPPPPDTREGAALAAAVLFAIVYLVIFVADYGAMTRYGFAFDVTTFSLVVGVVAAFALSTMLGSDLSTFQRLELELARTVLAYVGSGTPPPSDAPLAGVWRAHVAGAEESRRMARAHAYALGIFLTAALLALASTLLAGLGDVLGIQGVTGLAMFVEWFAFSFLAMGAIAVLASVGYAGPSRFYENLAPRRWRRNAGRQHAIDGAVSEIPWLAEYSRGARESRISPAGPPMIPSWHE